VEDNYKMECQASGDQVYLIGSFEMFFDNEESMLKLIDDLPEYYIGKYYKKSNNDKWVRIYLT
tara:strand:- start:466 stop:654 length:189 start_codon:yes stop_codon:yes gene_type:complete